MHCYLPEVWISTINGSRSGRIYLVILGNKNTHRLNIAQFALQGIARKSVYKISFENLLGCETWFNLQQRNWQLGVTASAGTVPCDKSLGLNKTTSPPCHFSTNKNLTSGQHNPVGQVQMYCTCSFNATFLYYITFYGPCLDIQKIKAKKSKSKPKHHHHWQDQKQQQKSSLTQRMIKWMSFSLSLPIWWDSKPSPVHCI